MSTLVTQPGARWWRGVGSPGLLGSVLASVAVLAVLLPLLDAASGDFGDFGGFVAEVVLVAGLVGVAVLMLPTAVVSGELAAEGLLLGVVTAIGRAAVIPLVRRRQS